MNKFSKGDFVELDGLQAVIVATCTDDDIPEGHVAIWFGEPSASRKSETNYSPISPEVWIVPVSACSAGLMPVFKH